ncbi:MAG: alpha/beta hydrolase [Phycisphaeraceae bacterium]|nr:alpha/beta hydrolase [Phycisphaeraceae bacterium]
MAEVTLARIRHHFGLLGILLVVSGCSGPQLVDTPVLYVGAVDNPFVSVPLSQQQPEITLLYGTDRTLSQSVLNGAADHAYGYGRARALTIGTCRARFGSDLTWDQLVAECRIADRRIDLPMRVEAPVPVATFAPTDTPVTIQGDALVENAEDAATNQLAVGALHHLFAERLADSSSKEVFVFVHGYNNTFDDAVLTMAQLWHFLARPGVGVIYSWPAGAEGLLRGYTHDRESGEFSIYHFKQFIRAIASCPQVQKIHFIGHSRGTDVLTTALRELHIENHGDPQATRRNLKLGQLVLAAPDLDYEVATQRIIAERLGAAPEGVTIYLNADDRAIGIADWLFASMRRLGQLRATDLTKRQQDAFERLEYRATFVNVRAELDFLGHGYFVSNPSVLSDLILLLRDNRQPGADHGRPLVRRGSAFWELYDGYPKPHPVSR